MIRVASRVLVVVVTLVAAAACAPRLKPLGGTAVPVRLPEPAGRAGRYQITFDWEYADVDMSGRGDGVARVASPDSVRLDLFLGGGFGSAPAVMLGDSLDMPGIELMRRLIPPPTLLWATLGRARLPATRDTVIRLDGQSLRADIGRPVQWRVTFRGDSLVRLEHVEGGRVVEWVDRGEHDRVVYRQESARRTLKLHITRVENVTAFDSAIWHIAH